MKTGTPVNCSATANGCERNRCTRRARFTGVPGVMVSIEDTIKGFKMILDGEVDYLPEQAFLNVGTIEEAIEKGKKLLDAASHKK